MSTKIARAARESICKGLITGSHVRSHGHFSRKRQKSERPGADGRNYSRSRSHLRAAAAMIGIKSPGLDGGCTGVRAKTGTCSWGRAVPPYYLGGARCLTRLSSIGAARLAAPFLIGRDPTRSAPLFYGFPTRIFSTPALFRCVSHRRRRHEDDRPLRVRFFRRIHDQD
jgi:hypothetical protein